MEHMVTAVHVHKMSLSSTSHLVTSMVDRNAYLDLEDHQEYVARWDLYGRVEHLELKKKSNDTRGINKPVDNR